MAPPLFCDLGKNCRDLFSKGYHFGVFRIESKLTPEGGPQFLANVTHAQDTGKVTGFLESKFSHTEYGVSIKERWNTDNQLCFEITQQDKLLKGLRLSLDGTMQPPVRMLLSFLRACYQHDMVTVHGDVSLSKQQPVLTGSIVSLYKGWLLGYQAAFKLGSNLPLKKSQLAFGYQSSDFVVHVQLNDGQEATSSVWVHNSSNLQTGVMMTLAGAGDLPRFALGCCYSLDQITQLRGKLTNQAQLGLSLEHRLRQGATLTLSLLIDGTSLNQGDHKVGLGLDFVA